MGSPKAEQCSWSVLRDHGFVFLGWWTDPVIHTPSEAELDGFCHWMNSERVFTVATIDQWRRRTRMFLQWYGAARLSELAPSDIDQYLVYGGTRGRCRT
jgi:hypothetical protein